VKQTGGAEGRPQFCDPAVAIFQVEEILAPFFGHGSGVTLEIAVEAFYEWKIDAVGQWRRRFHFIP
jgi:hypothetical protein